MSLLVHQRGQTLVTGLVMLLLLSILSVAAVRGSLSSMQVVGNAQFRDEAHAAAQQAIERLISDASFTLIVPEPDPIDANGDGAADYTVTFPTPPTCLQYKPAEPTDPTLPTVCYGSSGGAALCYWTVWNVEAAVADARTQASVAVNQGVKTIAGVNAALASCGL